MSQLFGPEPRFQTTVCCGKYVIYKGVRGYPCAVLVLYVRIQCKYTLFLEERLKHSSSQSQQMMCSYCTTAAFIQIQVTQMLLQIKSADD